MTSYRIRNEHQRRALLEDIEAAPLPFRAEVNEGDDRSLEQNRLAFKWYGEIAKQRHMSPDEAHRRCKLRYGVPILCRDSEDFCGTYERVLAPLPDPLRLEAMDLIEVTRLFTVAQMSEFLDTVYREQAMAGVRLTDPGEPALLRGRAA